MKKYMPLGISLFLLWSAVAAALWLSLKHTGGHFVYLRDDPYIHMAMARNLAEHGIWGITQYGFSSASSSILWTLLLTAVYRVFGGELTAPLAINIVLATLVCILFFMMLRKYKFGTPAVFLVLVAVVSLTPLPWLVFCGQEHILHLILTILFVHFAAKSLEGAGSPLKDIPVLAVLAALLTLSRYEGIFLLFAAFCLFIAKKRPLQGFIIGAAGMLPVLVYGMISLSRGWYFLPNSVLLKGNMPDYHSIKGVLELAGYTGLQQMARNPQILNLVVPAAVLLYIQRNRDKTIWNASSMMTIMFLITTLLHIQFAAAGGIFRYEAYLVALGIFVIALSLKETGGKFRYTAIARSLSARLALLTALVIFLSPFIVRGAVSFIWIPRACTNIYEQQYQMGLFIKNFYQHETVALNDVGLVNYMADIRCLDLLGLGSMDTAKARRHGKYNSRFIEKLAASKQTKIAVLYDNWFEEDGSGAVPQSWTRAGRWMIANNVACGDYIVSFYAVDESEALELAENLEEFAKRLPSGVARLK